MRGLQLEPLCHIRAADLKHTDKQTSGQNEDPWWNTEQLLSTIPFSDLKVVRSESHPRQLSLLRSQLGAPGGEKLATPQITTDSSKTTRSGPEEESGAVKFTDYSPDTVYNGLGAESTHFDTRSLDNRAFWSHLVGGWYV